MKKDVRWLEGLANILRVMCSLLMRASLVAMAVSVFLQIILRGVFRTSWLPLDDLVVYGFAVIVFTGVALVFDTNTHLATPVIVDALSPRAQAALHWVLDLLSLVFLVGMLYEGAIYARDGMSQYSPLLRVPVGLIYVASPISAFASIVFMVRRRVAAAPFQAVKPEELVD